MLFTVTVMHNITRAQGRPALDRCPQDPLLPGDTLAVVGILALPATSITDAAECVLAVANGAGAPRLAQVYRSWNVRSTWTGDVLAVDEPSGRRHYLACTTTGFRPVTNPRAYTILPGHQPTTSSTDPDPNPTTSSTDPSDRPPTHNPAPGTDSGTDPGVHGGDGTGNCADGTGNCADGDVGTTAGTDSDAEGSERS